MHEELIEVRDDTVGYVVNRARHRLCITYLISHDSELTHDSRLGYWQLRSFKVKLHGIMGG